MRRMTWLNPPTRFTEAADVPSIYADPGTDCFTDLLTGFRKFNAHLYLADIEGDFTLTCRVRPQWQTTYDAGGLFVRVDNDRWIKHAFELTDLGYPCIVGVVTDGASDDCNGERITADRIWLRVCRKGDYWGLHHSEDGNAWKMSRYFRFPLPEKLQAGLTAQSPMGEGCRVEFTDVSFENISVNDLRKGI